MATKKPATKRVAKAPAKKTATKTATKKPAVKKNASKNSNVLFSVSAVGDDITLQVEGNGERLVQAIASAISDEPNVKALLKMAVLVA